MDIENSIIVIIASGIISLGVAFLTAKYTRKSELDKIKADLHSVLITIESDNYRIMYEKKLEALKKIKEIKFTLLEKSSGITESQFGFMQDFPFKVFMNNVENLIINYSYIFENNEIADSLESIFFDAQETDYERDLDSSQWLEFYERIFEKFKNLVILVNADLSLNYYNVKKKFY